ncbi:DUF2165 family protein [Burkholderia sp. A9]|uniref:DUF2165 family protein n=1 Tax=Burkholderia sp. A9 TaxID=1365108 RepID=UPI000694FB14|nr:DUF2165 family protein [Burkholderia sp. A9]
MDTTFPGNDIMYRTIDTPWIRHHARCAAILSMERLTAVLCGIGSILLLRARRATGAAIAQPGRARLPG